MKRNQSTGKRIRKTALILCLALLTSVMCTALAFFARAEEVYVPVENVKDVTASSFVDGYEPYKAFDGIEGDANNCWHTPWGDDQEPFPHWIMAELDVPTKIDALVFIPRGPSPHTFVKDYEVWTSGDSDPAHLKKVAEGTWERSERGVAEFPEQEVVLVKFVIKSRVDSDTIEPWNTSVNASEIKLRMPESVIYDQTIQNTADRADSLLAYAQGRLGDGDYEFDISAFNELKEKNAAMKKLMGSQDGSAIDNAVSGTEKAITALLESARPDGAPMIMDVPVVMMSATASSSNFSYKPMAAIDGNISTIWHSEWLPDNDPFPHIFTLDLGRTLLLHDISILPRQDAYAGKIIKGEIHIGNSLDDIEYVTTFTSSADLSAKVVSLDCLSARYIRIVSVQTNSSNTAIAEITVSSYDTGVLGAFDVYERARDVSGRAVVGDSIGEYSQEQTEAFKKTLEDFEARLFDGDVTSYEMSLLGKEIEDAMNNFIASAKSYVKADLDAMIKELEEATVPEGDRRAVAKLLDEARAVASGTLDKDVVNYMCGKLSVCISAINNDAKSIDLSGKWELSLSDYEGQSDFEDSVTLPGTLDTNKVGTYNTLDETYRLSRLYSYVGPASYRKEIFVSSSLGDKELTLFMERTRATEVYVNGKRVSSSVASDLLPVPSEYRLTEWLVYGDFNEIVIVVDNSFEGLPAGAILASHMATAETQTNWNGILGRFELISSGKVSIDDLRVYPNDDLKSVTVKVDVTNNLDADADTQITLSLDGAESVSVPVKLAAGKSGTFVCENFAMPDDVKLWSEFHPDLYTLTASLPGGEIESADFGMRVFKVSQDGEKIENNGYAVLLRGEANCAVFPLTGYAPMDVESWEDLFGVYKSYGINFVRFHSWCPPEAAFEAADKLGMYLQPELSSWDGAMMSDDIKKEYYSEEAYAIIKEYANHPSFVMMTFGNELMYATQDLNFADELIGGLKKEDSTRLYAPGSNTFFGGFTPTANTDFYTSQAYMGAALRGSFGGLTGFVNQEYPNTMLNFYSTVSKVTALGVPVFSFEVGQYQVFPDILTETDKYTGVLEARNFEVIAEKARERGLTDDDIADWINASGMLSRLGYRMEIEAVRRTSNMAGISLLGIQDFPGQGTALVGMVNALGEPKPYDFADPEYFSSFFGPVAILLETEKFVYLNSEKITGTVLVSNYSESNVTGTITYVLEVDGKVIGSGEIKNTQLSHGQLSTAGSLSLSLEEITDASKAVLTIRCGELENSYSFWIYPDDVKAEKKDVYVAEVFDENVLMILRDGGKVFLSPRASADNFPNSVAGRFSTAFWSTNDKANQAGLMGLLIDPDHPLFESFPTDYYSDFQWWIMTTNGRPVNLEDFTDSSGEKIEPLIRVLDDLDGIKNMGLLYEVKVGEGRLVVSSMGLSQLKDEYPEAKALYAAILSYMNSDNFDPDFSLSEQALLEQLPLIESKGENVAIADNGSQFYLGKNTATCGGGYDGKWSNRLLEINDGVVDCQNNSRSWSDYKSDGKYPADAELGVDFSGKEVISSVGIAFFEDSGCKAAASVKIMYRDGDEFKEVSDPSMTTGFTSGMNTITFTPVTTDGMYFYIEHQSGMGIAISEILCYRQKVGASSISISGQGGATEVAVGQTLPIVVTPDPKTANGFVIKWQVTSADGGVTELAAIDTDGILTAFATGKVTVRASVYGEPSVSASVEIDIVEEISDPGSDTTDTTETEQTPDTDTPDTETPPDDTGDGDQTKGPSAKTIAAVAGTAAGIVVISLAVTFSVIYIKRRRK